MRKLNNFQRKETARWLLNISQGVMLGSVGSLLFIPGLDGRVGIIGAGMSMILSLGLYLAAMYVGKEVKNDK